MHVYQQLEQKKWNEKDWVESNMDYLKN